MTDFLWHKISEEEKKSIKEQAKSIMDNFSSKLSKIKKDIKEPLIIRDKCEREENENFTTDESFSKEIMFKNAPEKNDNFIIAERKKWQT